ncbi:MAG: bifunctional diaminohydroxyphosphoribosylaminopyrimidine deaminase/5-amino-6-(5-phosphoribosylamino)uracil reductase RibD [Flavobacteriaceae bacterium]
MVNHETYMRRALQLARLGLGHTFPNPMVGAVIVHDGHIIGEGYTSPYGGPHAEVNAIHSVKESHLLSKSTLYVTLEPCSHYGKTPPCSDMIVKKGIAKAVIGTVDPHKKVAGKGIEKLKNSGVEVTTGVLEAECRHHHRRFLTFHIKKRPYIILKWAETQDGFLAPEPEKRNHSPQPYWISNPKSRQLAHQWRAEEQAILVGTNTVLEDNPRLDVRQWAGTSPTRIVLDRNARVKGDYHVLDNTIETIFLTENTTTSPIGENIRYLETGAANGPVKNITNVLYRENILSVIIEGGAKTLNTFIEADCWDEARIFTGPKRFQKGIKAPKITGEQCSLQKIGNDTLRIIANDTKHSV